MSYRELDEDRLRRRPSLFLMVISILFPCGISISPLLNPTLPNLRFVLVDVLFALGASRTPGTDWTLDYYSSSLVTGNDMLLLVALPYLIGSLLSIVFLMGYLRKEISGKLLSIGIFTIIVVVMLVPMYVSILLVPITPLLALSIVFWANVIKMNQEEDSEN